MYVLLIFIFNDADGVAILFSSITAFWGKDWRRKWQPTPLLLPEKSHGWRSLVGYSPGVAKSRRQLSDFTFTFHFHALEKEMATHSSVLAWRIPGMGAWWAAIYGVAQSRTRLKRLSNSNSSRGKAIAISLSLLLTIALCC